MSGIEAPKTSYALAGLLLEYGVHSHDWGLHGSKPIQSLLHELHQGECYLQNEGERVVRCVTAAAAQVVYVHPKRGLLTLKELQQTMPTGEVRKRPTPFSVSEKSLQDESPFTTIMRGIKEELGVQLAREQIEPQGNYRRRSESMSYPGLMTIYDIHEFVVSLNDDQFYEHGYQETQPTGLVSVFSWM